MKKLIIMRHAKSDWSMEEIKKDFDRPLNKRGLKDAPRMGEEIKKQNLIPELIISSPAKRALKTANLVAKNCTYKSEIKEDKAFYFGYKTDIRERITNLDSKLNTVMIFGHNPTFSELVTYYTGEFMSMPTASFAVVTVDSENWKDFDYNKCKLELFLKPKDLK